jgi:hypothetical protein
LSRQTHFHAQAGAIWSLRFQPSSGDAAIACTPTIPIVNTAAENLAPQTVHTTFWHLLRFFYQVLTPLLAGEGEVVENPVARRLTYCK